MDQPKERRHLINRAGKDREDTLARNWSSISMGYTRLSRSWTLDRRSQGRRSSFGYQIGSSNRGDPTLMLVNTLFLLIGGLGSEHLRGWTAAIDGGRRVRPSRGRTGSSATGNRRRPRRSSGPREWGLIGRRVGGRRRT